MKSMRFYLSFLSGLLLVLSLSTTVWAQESKTSDAASNQTSGSVKGVEDVWNDLLGFFRHVPILGTFIQADQDCSNPLDSNDLKNLGTSLRSEDSRHIGLTLCGDEKPMVGELPVTFTASKKSHPEEVGAPLFWANFDFTGTEIYGSGTFETADYATGNLGDSTLAYLGASRDPEYLQKIAEFPDMSDGPAKQALRPEIYNKAGVVWKLLPDKMRRIDPDGQIGGWDTTKNVFNQRVVTGVMMAYACGWDKKKNGKTDETSEYCKREQFQDVAAGWLRSDGWYDAKPGSPTRPFMASEFVCANLSRNEVPLIPGPVVDEICDLHLGVTKGANHLNPNGLIARMLKDADYDTTIPVPNELVRYKPGGLWDLMQHVGSKEVRLPITISDSSVSVPAPAGWFTSFFPFLKKVENRTVTLGGHATNNYYLEFLGYLTENAEAIAKRRDEGPQLTPKTDTLLGSNIKNTIAGFTYDGGSIISFLCRIIEVCPETKPGTGNTGSVGGAVNTLGDVLAEEIGEPPEEPPPPPPPPKETQTIRTDVSGTIKVPHTLWQENKRARWAGCARLPSRTCEDMETTLIDGVPLSKLPCYGARLVTKADFDLVEGNIPTPFCGGTNLFFFPGSAEKNDPAGLVALAHTPLRLIPPDNNSVWVRNLARLQTSRDWAQNPWTQLASFRVEDEIKDLSQR